MMNYSLLIKDHYDNVIAHMTKNIMFLLSIQIDVAKYLKSRLKVPSWILYFIFGQLKVSWTPQKDDVLERNNRTIFNMVAKTELLGIQVFEAQKIY